MNQLAMFCAPPAPETAAPCGCTDDLFCRAHATEHAHSVRAHFEKVWHGLTCDQCGAQVDAVIGGLEGQAGAWCLPCCDAAALKVPESARRRHVTDNQSAADREAWTTQRAAEKRAKLERFLASRKS